MTESTFEKIAARLHRKAEHASLACGMGAMAAEDVAQDVMLKLWAIHDELEDEERLPHLAALMARRLSLNAMRDSRTVPLAEGALRQESLSPGPSEVLELREAEAWLQERIDGLPAMQNIILTMRQVEKRGNKEIAALLGIEPASVSTLLSRARHTLLEEIRKRNRR